MYFVTAVVVIYKSLFKAVQTCSMSPARRVFTLFHTPLQSMSSVVVPHVSPVHSHSLLVAGGIDLLLYSVN